MPAKTLSAREQTKLLNDAADLIERKGQQPASRAAGDTTALTGTTTLPATPSEHIEKSFGFRSFAHFLHDVRLDEIGQPTTHLKKAYDSETIKKAATGMGELSGSDGGYLVPPQFSTNVFERMYREDPLMSKTDSYTVAGDSMVFPRNAETSRATGSRWGGVRAYWVQEGSTITASAPTFGQVRLQLQTLACLARVTNQLIEDSGVPLEQYLTRVFASEIGFACGNAIFRGTGAGQALGILNALAKVEVSKETGQAAATIVAQNIAKMWARRFGLGPENSYIWLTNQDTEPQLFLMTLGIGTAGVVVLMPPGGLSAKPYATMMGSPVLETEYASTLGTVGDIVLVDPSQIVTITKGGVQSLSSMHVYFVTHETAFKSTFRFDAAGWQASALTPFQGTNTQAPVVTLATRS